MQALKEVLERRIYELRQIIQEKENALKRAPIGSVQVSGTSKRQQFYFNQNGKRKYAKDAELPLVRKLCQKDYDQRTLAAAQKELKELEKLCHNYQNKSFESIYQKLNPERKKLVTPIVLPDEEYVQQWKQKEYKGKGFADNAPEFYTNRGERVRSKTEILIANALQKHQIPYRYEYPCYLEQYGTVYPDFTALNVRTRKEILWEHMGLFDDDNYREYALDKIIAYEKNDIFPGDKLILTHETSRTPINSKIIEKIIFQYLK